jgi:dTDP-4-amino-4,6-dideoxygalactose transaminase
MDNLRAAILRPQLRQLEAQCTAWNDRYQVVDQGLAQVVGLMRIQRPHQEKFVASSYQFLLLDWSSEAIRSVLARCLARGVELKWFGAPDPVGFTSRYDSWTYAPSTAMPKSDRILHGVIDMRLPLTFSLDDCATVARIIAEEVAHAAQGRETPV